MTDSKGYSFRESSKAQQQSCAQITPYASLRASRKQNSPSPYEVIRINPVIFPYAKGHYTPSYTEFTLKL